MRVREVFRFEGAREFERALGELETLFRRKKAARDTLLEAAEPIRALAQANAPVRVGGPEKRWRKPGDEKGNPTGIRRRGALRLHVSKGTRLSRRQGAMNRAGKMPVEVYVGTRDRIGRLVEFGTRKVPPQPFLRDAWDAEGGQPALDRISAGLWLQIERQGRLQAKAAQRAARKRT